jgi:hypothetical protein
MQKENAALNNIFMQNFLQAMLLKYVMMLFLPLMENPMSLLPIRRGQGCMKSW